MGEQIADQEDPGGNTLNTTRAEATAKENPKSRGPTKCQATKESKAPKTGTARRYFSPTKTRLQGEKKNLKRWLVR